MDYFSILFSLSSLTSAQQSYKAGVALYQYVKNPSAKTPDARLKFNAAQYVNLMTSVKGKVDILVFPEYGLTTDIVSTKVKDHLEPFSTIVEDVNTRICNKSVDSFMSVLACASETSGISIVVNVVEKSGNDYYSTNVAIDTTGTIVLRCRKHHLMKSDSFSAAADQKSCVFEAKFKSGTVPFFVMFDTDIVHPIPEDLKREHVIMTSWIKNEMPLGFSLGLESGFAVGNNVNLLVSNYVKLEENYGGSGIYHKNGSSLVAMSAKGIVGAIQESTVIIDEVRVNTPAGNKINVVAKLIGEMPSLSLNYKNITVLEKVDKDTTECIDGPTKKICCKFSADITIAPYRWVAIRNKTTIFNQTVDVLICALIKPNSSAPTMNFKNVEISSDLGKSDAGQTLPLVLNKGYLPTSFVYEYGESGPSIRLSKEEELLVFGIVQVLNPNGSAMSSSSSTALIVVIVLLVLLLLAVVGFLIWRKRQRKNRSSF
ncbi:hypothetical protein JTB14_000875 [Gonioctena quinquepunctata]|nr:hypothetical protein JTB14_000875 [Gonioctena quinquepunctata]